MKKMQILSVFLLGSAPVVVLADPYSQSFSFATPAEQAEWNVTTNYEFNGPGVPQYGVPDAGSVLIAPDGGGNKVAGDILLERVITAPAGYTFSNLVFSGRGQGFSGWVNFAELGISTDGSYLATWPDAGSPNSVPVTGETYAQDRASAEFAEVPIIADASSVAALNGVSSFHLRIRIQDALALGTWPTHAPYARDLMITGTLTGPPSSDSTWNINGSGDWNSSGNWTTGIPNGADAKAMLGDKITSAQTVYTNAAITLGSLTIDNANTYVISGAGSLTIDVTSGSGLIDVVQGTHKLNLPVSIADTTDLNTGTAATLVVGNPLTLEGGITLNKNGAGTLLVQAPLNAPAAAILKINGGVVNLDTANNDPDISVDVDPATLNLGANQTLGTVTLSLGGNTVRVGRDSTGDNVPARLTVSNLIVTGGGSNILQQTVAGNTTKVAGVLQIDSDTTLLRQGPGVLVAGSVNLAATAKLDLLDGKLIVDYTGGSPLADVKAQIVSGRAGGAWNGNGIQSSVAAITPQRALGYVDTAVTGPQSFGGENADGSSILVGYTVLGDANLDGTVSSLDLNALVADYGATANGQWYRGDFNYDNKVNTLDFNYLAGNFGVTVSAPMLGSVVPEPASLSLALGVGLLSRRRVRA